MFIAVRTQLVCLPTLCKHKTPSSPFSAQWVAITILSYLATSAIQKVHVLTQDVDCPLDRFGDTPFHGR
jgi:hypothetical protein